MAEELLIMCTHGPENPERATIPNIPRKRPTFWFTDKRAQN